MQQKIEKIFLKKFFWNFIKNEQLLFDNCPNFFKKFLLFKMKK